ncbi:hypothetical protein CQ476_17 [TM7 phage DolZOral124_53_65]|nr:hypothetical protein CQ476_17 [TM7 phage DolZOral124_53_65]
MTIEVESDNTGPQEVDVRTKAERTRDKLLAKDPDHYRRIGHNGGLKSSSRPFKDPEVARFAVNMRWEKERALKKANRRRKRRR